MTQEHSVPLKNIFTEVGIIIEGRLQCGDISSDALEKGGQIDCQLNQLEAQILSSYAHLLTFFVKVTSRFFTLLFIVDFLSRRVLEKASFSGSKKLENAGLPVDVEKNNMTTRAMRLSKVNILNQK